MKKDVEDRLARLREAIEGARSMPMSASAVINRQEVLDLVDDVATALDEAFAAADTVVDDRDAVVASGQTAADEILKKAHDESERLVAETHVFQVAQERAHEVEDAAKRGADDLRAEADRYVEEKLAHFEATLMRTLEAVQRGRARISDDTLSPGGDTGLGFPADDDLT